MIVRVVVEATGTFVAVECVSQTKSDEFRSGDLLVRVIVVTAVVMYEAVTVAVAVRVCAAGVVVAARTSQSAKPRHTPHRLIQRQYELVGREGQSSGIDQCVRPAWSVERRRAGGWKARMGCALTGRSHEDIAGSRRRSGDSRSGQR